MIIREEPLIKSIVGRSLPPASSACHRSLLILFMVMMMMMMMPTVVSAQEADGTFVYSCQEKMKSLWGDLPHALAFCEEMAYSVPKSQGGAGKESIHTFATFQSAGDFMDLLGAAICVLCAALASGLTIGLLSIDKLELEIKQRVGTELEIHQANRILPLLERRHILLVTLLLFNSMAAEALPLFLDELVPAYVAVIISVTMVLFFGEIFPSAIFSGPNQLRFGARLSGLIWCLIIAFFPIAWPVAKFLDWFLGDDSEHSKRYNRSELSALIEIHHHQQQQKQSKGGGGLGHSNGSSGGGSYHRRSNTNSMNGSRNSQLTKSETGGSFVSDDTVDNAVMPTELAQHSSNLLCDPAYGLRGKGEGRGESSDYSDCSSHAPTLLTSREVDIVVGVLSIATTTVRDCYVPWSEIFCLRSHDILDEDMLLSICNAGYSRIPVCKERNEEQDAQDPHHVIGFVLTKHLITVDPRETRPVSSLSLRLPIIVSPDCPLIDLLGSFQTGRAHLALVSADPHAALKSLMKGEQMDDDTAPIGIITLEDVMEEILQGEIYDEKDIRDGEDSCIIQRESTPEADELRKAAGAAAIAASVSGRATSSASSAASLARYPSSNGSLSRQSSFMPTTAAVLRQLGSSLRDVEEAGGAGGGSTRDLQHLLSSARGLPPSSSLLPTGTTGGGGEEGGGLPALAAPRVNGGSILSSSYSSPQVRLDMASVACQALAEARLQHIQNHLQNHQNHRHRQHPPNLPTGGGKPSLPTGKAAPSSSSSKKFSSTKHRWARLKEAIFHHNKTDLQDMMDVSTHSIVSINEEEPTRMPSLLFTNSSLPRMEGEGEGGRAEGGSSRSLPHFLRCGSSELSSDQCDRRATSLPLTPLERFGIQHPKLVRPHHHNNHSHIASDLANHGSSYVGSNHSRANSFIGVVGEGNEDEQEGEVGFDLDENIERQLSSLSRATNTFVAVPPDPELMEETKFGNRRDEINVS